MEKIPDTRRDPIATDFLIGERARVRCSSSRERCDRSCDPPSLKISKFRISLEKPKNQEEKKKEMKGKEKEKNERTEKYF